MWSNVDLDLGLLTNGQRIYENGEEGYGNGNGEGGQGSPAQNSSLVYNDLAMNNDEFSPTHPGNNVQNLENHNGVEIEILNAPPRKLHLQRIRKKPEKIPKSIKKMRKDELANATKEGSIEPNSVLEESGQIFFDEKEPDDLDRDLRDMVGIMECKSKILLDQNIQVTKSAELTGIHTRFKLGFPVSRMLPKNSQMTSTFDTQVKVNSVQKRKNWEEEKLKLKLSKASKPIPPVQNGDILP